MNAKPTICLLYGGKSGEHDVSRRSAASVARHLDPDRYELVAVGIDRNGRWHLQGELRTDSPVHGDDSLTVAPSAHQVSLVPMAGIHVDGRRLHVDCVFPVLHGDYGEDGRLQGALETAGLAYVGAGVLGSSAGMDKAVAKALWRDAGLPVVDFVVADERTPQHELEELALRFGWPLFVKPCCGGSSLGASRADDMAGLRRAIGEALRHDRRVLIEPCLNVRELECSVVGNDDDVHVFAPGEIVTSQQHGFYDYEAKYTDPNGADLHDTAELDLLTRERITSIARAAFLALRCEGMARVDFFLDKDSSKLYLNEINTIPGFTSISMFPRMCRAGGLGYGELLDRLIGLALHRHSRTGTASQ